MDERRRLFSTEEGVGEVRTHPLQPSVFHGPAFELFRPGDELIQAQRIGAGRLRASTLRHLPRLTVDDWCSWLEAWRAWGREASRAFYTHSARGMRRQSVG